MSALSEGEMKRLERQMDATDKETLKEGRCDWCGKKGVQVKLDHTRDALACEPCIFEGHMEISRMIEGEDEEW